MNKLKLLPLTICYLLLLVNTSWANSSCLFPHGTILAPPAQSISGEQTQFFVFIPQAAFQNFQPEKAEKLEIIIKNAKKTHKTEATNLTINDGITKNDSMKSLVAKQTYIQQTYAFDLPRDMTGVLTLSMAGSQNLSTMFMVNPENIQPTGQIAVQEKDKRLQPLSESFSWYKPVYFLFGADPGIEYSKFQFSFKYRLFNPKNSKGPSWRDGCYLAYTQTSYWDLKSDSMPFDDSSYKPELFYIFPKIDLSIPWINTFGVQTGFRHESNGKGGEDSRSTNTMYIEPVMGFFLGENYFLEIKPRAWFYVKNENESNQDLYKYRGYFSLGLGIGNPDGLMLNTNTAFAEKGETLMMDLSFPLSILHDSLNFFFHVQYVNGYAERLLDYPEKEETLRIGFSIIR